MKQLLLLLLPVISFGQKLYTGTVISTISKKGIPYATIGFVKQKTGVNANEQGKFLLPGPYAKNDSLRISSVGYETLVVPVELLADNKTFELAQKQFALEEVVISSRTETENLNEFSNCGSRFYVSTGTITQVAQHFQSAKTNSMLTHIHICKQASNSLFRVRIYGIEPVTKQPGKDLLNEPIEVRSSGRNVKIDLEKYKIIIPGNDFFIAIEWIYIPLNEYKTKAKLNGKKFTYSNYDPGISFTKNTVNEDVWAMNFAGKWDRISWYYENINLLIAARLSH